MLILSLQHGTAPINILSSCLGPRLILVTVMRIVSSHAIDNFATILLGLFARV